MEMKKHPMERAIHGMLRRKHRVDVSEGGFEPLCACWKGARRACPH